MAAVELKRVSFSARSSEETLAFAADVWIDGVKAGTVRNRGTGGCNDYSPHTLADCLDAIARKRGSTQAVEAGDGLVGDLFNAWLNARSLKRLMAKWVVFARAASDGRKAFYTISPDARGRLQPTDIILNDMPLADAVALYAAQ